MDANELDALREDIELLLPERCNILEAVKAPDGMGGFTISWGTADASVPCRLDVDTIRGGLQTAGAAQVPAQALRLTVPYGRSLTTVNRVELDETTYAVTTVSAGSWLGCKRATLELLWTS